MNLQKTIYIGLIISPIYFCINCKKNQTIYITEALDSLPRLMPGNACYPKSSFNPKSSLICYYNSTMNLMFFESKHKKGKFAIGNHGKFVTFYPHNLDTVFIMYDDSIILYNYLGQVLKSIYYERKFKHHGIPFRIGKMVLDVPNLAYDERSHMLFLPCMNLETNWWEKSFFRNSMLIVGIDINSGSIKYYPIIKYPNEYTSYSYGELANYFYTLKDYNELYFSFNAVPEIYKYQLSSDPIEIEKITLPDLKEIPQYDSNYREDLNIVLEYQKLIDTYWKLMYDPFKKLFYRFHTRPTVNTGQKAHGSYQANFDVILAIYDEEFNELKRLNLGDSVNHYGSFISHKGLHLKLFKNSDIYEYFKIISVSK